MKAYRQVSFQTTAMMLPRNAGRSIRAQVVLGSPAAGCSDVGVCRVIPADVELGLKCPLVLAWISRTEENKIRFSFLAESIPAKAMHKHFSWGLFQVIEPFALPDFLCRSLKAPKCNIEPGIYQVLAKGDRIIVDF